MKRLVAFFLLCMVARAGSLALPRTPSTLLIVPDRLAIIRFAFDMKALRQAEVVCWRESQEGAALRLFYWKAPQWQPISTEAFRTLSFLPRTPDKIIVLGLRPEGLETLLDRGDLAFIESFDAAVLTNHLDPFYAFSPEEWRLLSRRYGFMTVDLNAQRREQSRYSSTPPPDKPGRRLPPVIFRTPAPPATVQEAPQTSPPEPAPVEMIP